MAGFGIASPGRPYGPGWHVILNFSDGTEYDVALVTLADAEAAFVLRDTLDGYAESSRRAGDDVPLLVSSEPLSASRRRALVVRPQLADAARTVARALADAGERPGTDGAVLALALLRAVAGLLRGLHQLVEAVFAPAAPVRFTTTPGAGGAGPCAVLVHLLTDRERVVRLFNQPTEAEAGAVCATLTGYFTNATDGASAASPLPRTARARAAIAELVGANASLDLLDAVALDCQVPALHRFATLAIAALDAGFTLLSLVMHDCFPPAQFADPGVESAAGTAGREEASTGAESARASRTTFGLATQRARSALESCDDAMRSLLEPPLAALERAPDILSWIACEQWGTAGTCGWTDDSAPVPY